MPTTAPRRSIAELTAAYRPGYSLEQDFYLRPDIFEADLRMLTGRWFLAGHVSEIPENGAWITAELGAESAIIVRGFDGVVRALANVCPHRGSRVCVERAGEAALFTCPYHAWTFRLDGALRSAREMPPGFDPSAHGLEPLPVSLIGGLIFVSFDDNPPDLTEAEPHVARMLALYDWENARVADRKTYTVAANWKLVMENYHECYHCGPSHPHFSVLHALARPNQRTLTDQPDAFGLTDYEAWGPTAGDAETVRVMRSQMAEGMLTGSAGGQAVAPPMGPAGAAWDGRCVFGELGLLSAFLAYADNGLIYRFIPRGVLETEMEVIWLTAGVAKAGVDYDLEQLTWLWDVTSQEDKLIIERNQAGVSSRAYRPGPFSLMEPGTQQYAARYVNELARSLGA